MSTDEFNGRSIAGMVSVIMHGASEEIDCGGGRTVSLTYGGGALYDQYEQAKRHPSVAGKTGEAFVAAILAVENNGIQKCQRELNGRTNDGPNGEPAYVEFVGGIIRRIDHDQDGKTVTREMRGATGETVQMAYFKDGKPCQGPNGEPGLLSTFSEKNYDEQGRPTSEKEFYKNRKPKTLIEYEYKGGESRDEKRFDESGVLRSHWVHRADGSRRSEFYNENGRLSDIKYDNAGHHLRDDAHGRNVIVAAAVEERTKDGTLISEEHYIGGVKVEVPGVKIKKPGRVKAVLSHFQQRMGR